MSASVHDVLTRFLGAFEQRRPILNEAKHRAIWAWRHCRTPTMGGHLHTCRSCDETFFTYHSCNHRSCPLCGGLGNVQWVQRELSKRVGAPYFMVTFTLPAELRPLFHSAEAKEAYDLFFKAASSALSDLLANPKWLGAKQSGFTMVLHTWTQRMGFHPHIHTIVPGAGLDAQGRVVRVKNPDYLVPVKAIRRVFRARFWDLLAASSQREACASIPAEVWQKSWGVDLQPFGSGANAIRYLGAYVCRTVIGDKRILSVDEETIRFSWKDRAHGGLRRTDTIKGEDFVSRYIQHVLPRGLKSIRYYGFCHPAAKKKRERIAMHTGCPLEFGLPKLQPVAPKPRCHKCGEETEVYQPVPAPWKRPRGPPEK